MQRLVGSVGTFITTCGVLGAFGAVTAAADPVTVFAASSLRDAVSAVAESYEAETGSEMTLVFAATSAIARQAAAGAPADAVLLADVEWADWLIEEDVFDTATPFAGNALVVIGATNTPLESLDALPAALDESVLSLAQVDAVPAGRYAKAALLSLGLWDDLESKVVQASNVRAALRFVERGEAALGVGYASDLVALPELHEVFRFSSDAHPPIVYAGGALTAEGSDFVTYLTEAPAQGILADWGFTALEPEND